MKPNGRSIIFYVDEMWPVPRVDTLLGHRGHEVRRPFRGEPDRSILTRAEAEGGVVVTGDAWFFRQLHPRHPGARSTYRRAGVVYFPGEWEAAEPLLGEWLPVIEAAYAVIQGRSDKRLVVAFEPGQSRIVIDNDPDPTVVRRLRRADIPNN